MTRSIKRWKSRFAERFRRVKVYYFFYLKRLHQTSHHLSKPVIVSLTSYPERYNVLHLTLMSLLTQDVQADMLVLWVHHKDFDLLPDAVVRLQRKGLVIEVTDEDIKSYTKLIPSLRKYKDCFLVTADDDVCYSREWLEVLLEGYVESSKEVVCHRAHLIRLDENGHPLPYADWEFDTTLSVADPRVFPTGVAGVLYPPQCFDPEVLNVSALVQLAPDADDIWFYSMFRRNRFLGRKVEGRFAVKTWSGTQNNALWRKNLTKKQNDRQLHNIIEVYGKPSFDLS